MRKSVFIIDSDEVFVRSLKDALIKEGKYYVIGYSFDGNNAIEALKKYGKVDFLIINPVLPIKDGYELLSEIKEDKELCINHILVEQFFVNEFVINSFKNLNVEDYILKPCHPRTIITHLEQFEVIDSSNELISIVDNDNSLEKKISLLLHKIGIPSSIKGYVYLRESIRKIYYSDDGYLGAITKRLYPEVAKKYMTTSSRVERAIRHAIEVSISRGDINTISKIFGATISRFKDKPTNAEFISIFAEYLKIEGKNGVKIF